MTHRNPQSKAAKSVLLFTIYVRDLERKVIEGISLVVFYSHSDTPVFCALHKMESQSDLDRMWELLTETNEHLQIPLIYVIAPLSAIAFTLLICCCYFCTKACCYDDPDVHFIPSVPPGVRPRYPVNIIRSRQDQTDGPSCSVRDIDIVESETVVELDENALDRVNAMYKKRNYQVRE